MDGRAVTLPGPVRELCDRFLLLVERELPPGFVTGLYLHGGLAFGEWAPQESDVDFLATVARPPDVREVEVLRELHAELAEYSPIRFDGPFVLADDLARDPRTVPARPEVINSGELLVHCSPAWMVAWHELASAGITITGPELSTLTVWTDKQALREYTVGNLDTYWRRNAEGLARATVADLPADERRRDYILTHCILASTRLHHLLATGEQTAKCRAGRWALTAYDQRWHRVLKEGLYLRAGEGVSTYDGHSELLADTRDFLAHVVETTTGKPVVEG
ncbi:aminoglycoside adenylyltransferase domain-containing protein [Kribbella jejuensis]|uniref:aminoglycoside adenylyltransferase domain-containing protein n=1 Tax=Kribbella jejuensis TaxID=236068 RepID=UPI00163AAF01|nr:aminoglycoside adenylyltransferase domain-containing protein [Kribbella jejuensis]